MGSLVELASPLQQEQASPTPNYRTLRVVSRWLEGLFAVLTGAVIAVLIVGCWLLIFYKGGMIGLGPRGGLITTEPLPPDFISISNLRLDQRLVYILVLIVRSAPAIGLFWSLKLLFRLYRQGAVFSQNNAVLIRAMGLWLLADAVAPFASHTVLRLTGYEIDKVWEHLQSVQELVLGTVVIVIALVMQAGHAIEQDREGFV